MIINGEPIKLILIKPNQLREQELVKYYGTNFVAISTPNKNDVRKELIADLCKTTPTSVKCIICADTDMFKTLCKVKTITGLDGYPTKSLVNDLPAFLAPNYYSIIYNPEQKLRLNFIMDKVNAYINGTYKEFGTDIIQEEHYPTNFKEVSDFLKYIKDKPSLTIDIETSSNHTIKLDPDEEKKFKSGLHHYSNNIYSIGFAWDKHHGGSFLYNKEYKELLREFFLNYKGKKIFHNASFDITQLIYHLFMDNLEDYKHMLIGLHCMCDNSEDTMLIAYLATNSCGKTELGLKALSHEFSGNYAEDVNDCTKVPVKDLLIYNLKDVLSTWYVYEKYYPKMVEENQEEIYKNLFLSSQKTLIETQLVGLRIKPNKLDELASSLYNKYKEYLKNISENPKVKQFNTKLQLDAYTKYNQTHKRQKQFDDFSDIEFNPASNDQLARLLYAELALPVLDLTATKNPACGADTLEKLKNHIQSDEILDLLENIIGLSKVNKIITSFIPSFYHTPIIKGMRGLYGSFKLGGTVSGRLSSSNPNLQQLPSTGSPYAKPVKKIFGAPKGYVFCGADQRSLEDRISALTTRDPNKLRVYTEDYDGHCLRAYSYFGDQMPDIHLAEEGTKVYKVTKNDGEVIYCTEEELRSLGE